MQQRVDARDGVAGVELLGEDAPYVLAPQGADAVLGRRAVVEPRLQPGLVGPREGRGPAGPGPVGQGLGLGPAVAVQGRLLADGAEAAAHRLGDLGRGASASDQEDGPHPGPGPGALPSPGELLQLVVGLRLGVHRSSPGSWISAAIVAKPEEQR